MRINKKSKLFTCSYLTLLIIILIASIFIRFLNLSARSLWFDEAWLANAINASGLNELISRSFHAPLFFVLTIHWMAIIFGNNEFILRLLPCLFGIGTLIIFYLLMRRHSGKMATLTSLLLLSFSSNAVYYSHELKQYSGAMFFAILLIYICERVVNYGKLFDWMAFLFLSILGVGFDHSIAFIVASVFAVLLIYSPQKKFLMKTLIAGFIFFIFGVFFYLFHFRHQISKSLELAQSFWLPYYPDTTSLSALLKWLTFSTNKMLNFFSFPYFPVSLTIIIVGLCLFYKNSHRRFIIYILMPVMLVLMASFLKRYPYGGSRLMLFVAPLLYLSFGKGLDFVVNKLERSRLYFPLILVILFISISPVSNFVKMASHPLRLEEMRPLLDELKDQVKSEDMIYVYYGAAPAFRYYYQSKFYRMADKRNIIWGELHRDDPEKYIADLEKILQKNMRIWIIFSHYWENERSQIVDYLNKRGNLEMNIINTGVSAYLFKMDS